MFDCFKKDYSKPSRDYGSHGEGEPFTPKWGYVVPHTEKAQGAEAPDGKWSEYKHGLSVAVTNSNFIPWDDRNNGGVSGAVSRLISDKKINSTWEDHRNAFDGRVGGVEVLCIRGDSLSKHYAEMILDAFHETFPDRNIRGVKEMKKGGRGYGNLLASKKAGADVALLGELFFIDNPKDFIEVEKIAKFLRRVLV